MKILELSTKELEKQFSLSNKNGILDDSYIDFLKAVTFIQQQNYIKLKADFTENYGSKIEKKIKLNTYPLLERKNFCYDLDNSQGIFSEILELMLNQDNHLKEIALEIKNLLSCESLKYSQLFDNYIKEKQNYFIPFVELFKSSPSIMPFLAYNSLLPSILLCSKVVIDYTHYDYRVSTENKACPICSSIPYLATLGERKSNSAGEQYNHCSFCKTEYRVKRLQCSFCQCEDHTKLGYYSVEQFPDIQLQICKNCNNYIKLIEQTHSIPLEIIDKQTLSLDIAIQNEGYIKHDA